FADASDFTFVFVGSFTPASLKPFVEQYLGSLPSTDRKETWKDVGMLPVTGVVDKTVRKGIEPKGQTALAFTGPFAYTRPHRVAIRALGMVLDTRLREVLREDLGGTYGVSVNPNYTLIPREQYNLTITFGCNPDRVDELVKAVHREIEALKANGPTEKQLADVKEAMLREFETNSKQNGYLLSQIYFRYQVPQDLGEFFTLPEFYKTLTAALIQDAAKAYLNTGNVVRVTLLPEAAK
ncbi:MAG: insulinase family protein, partial [Acidobacteria bacterium]|nr:insulinase family protein [Acidobacteriota bacterium]